MAWRLAGTWQAWEVPKHGEGEGNSGSQERYLIWLDLCPEESSSVDKEQDPEAPRETTNKNVKAHRNWNYSNCQSQTWTLSTWFISAPQLVYWRWFLFSTFWFSPVVLVSWIIVLGYDVNWGDPCLPLMWWSSQSGVASRVTHNMVALQ